MHALGSAMMRFSRFSLLASCFSFLVVFLTLPAFADKVIMKDGKIYEGHIMGESAKSVLIRLNTQAKPTFLHLEEVQTIVRESHPTEAPSEEAGRFASAEVMLLGQTFSGDTFNLHTAPGLGFAGGFRLHPAVELGAGLNLWPTLNGDVTVSDGRTLRGYEQFSAWSGGFHAKVFPFFRQKYPRWEPFLLGGYHWNRLTAKGSGDYFTGNSWWAGVGTSWRWWNPVPSK